MRANHTLQMDKLLWSNFPHALASLVESYQRGAILEQYQWYNNEANR